MINNLSPSLILNSGSVAHIRLVSLSAVHRVN